MGTPAAVRYLNCRGLSVPPMLYAIIRCENKWFWGQIGFVIA